jgi:Protein of unknown function (DUF4058)
MPLRDHFHPPLSLRRQWTSFHGAWATYLSAQINRLLPPGYFAEPLCAFITEIDIATFEEDGDKAIDSGAYTPPPPTATVMMAAATDTVEIRVYHQEEGPQLVACVEFVSPSNKDRPGEREAFVSKCAAYLHEGVGLVVVDIVTTRHANLHAALLTRLSGEPASTGPGDLYAVAYRPVPGEQQTEVRIWEETLAVGQALPTVPLWLKTGQSLPLELEATYEQTCRELRLVASNGIGP